MPQTYGATTVSSAVPQRAFRNISAQVVSFSAGGSSYSLAPMQLVSIPAPDANSSTDIVALLTSGALQELVVYGAKTLHPIAVEPPSTPITPVPVSFTQATQSSITGTIAGITIDADGHWLLADGNRMLYASSKLRQQPAPGLTSAITVAATMARTAVAGSFGFALYTDAAPTAASFENGLVVLYESTGLCNVYQVQGTKWNCITDRSASGVFNQVPYPLDANEHTYAVVAQQPDTDTLKLTAFCDSQPVATATLTNGNFVTSGSVGFATTGGSVPISIVPNSFEFQLGVDLRENMPAAVQEIVQVDTQGNPRLNVAPSGGAAGTLAQANTDPAVVAGSVTGSAKNLVPDSDLKFIDTLWNTSQAGVLSVLPGMGLSGGNGIVFTAHSAGAIGQLHFISSAMTVLEGQPLSISGNIQNLGAIAGAGGLPAWELWSLNSDGTLNTLLEVAAQQLGVGSIADGKARVKYENYVVPPGITSVGIVASTNNVALGSGATLIFSEPQLEVSPFATAYVSNLLDESGTVPYAGLPDAVTSAVDPSGQIDVSAPQPGTQLPLGANSQQVQSTIATSASGNTYLAGQTVSTQNVAPTSIAGSQAKPAVYTNAVANIFNNLSNSSQWYVPGIGPIDATTAIPDGSSLIYSVAIVDPAASPVPVQDQLKIAANATISVIFNHPAFVATAPGSTRVAFAGSQQSAASNLQEQASLADSSSPSITTVTTQQTSLNAGSRSFSDTGNPQITSSQQSTTSNQAQTQAVSDTETPAITSGANNSTTAQPFTASVPSTASTPAITASSSSTTSPQPFTQAESNASTATITSASSTGDQNQLQTSSANASGTAEIVPTYHPNTGNAQKSGTATAISSTAAITSSSNTTYANTAKSGAATGVTSAPAITKTVNAPTYTTNQHSSGSVSGTGSQGSLYYVTSSVQSATGPGGSWATSHTHFTERDCTTDPPIICQTIDDGNEYEGGGSSTVTLGAYTEPPTGATPMVFTPTITSSTFVTWSVQLKRPNGTVYATWTPTSGSAITVSDNNETAIGAWSWTITATPLASDWNGGGGGIKQNGTAAASSSLTYYKRLTYGQYGALKTIASTPANTLAPTSAGTQLQFTVSAVSKPSDANGTSGMIVYLYDPNGNQVASWGDSPSTPNIVAVNAVFSYSAASAIAGAYTWKYLTNVVTSTNQSTSTYTDTVTGTATWYQSDQNPTTYTFATTAGATTTLTTSAAALPSGTGTAQTLALSNVVVPSDANGATSFHVDLYDSNNSLVQSWTNQTAAATLSYTTTSSAPVGTWTWKLYAVIQSDAQVNAETYTCTVTAQAGWYESVGTTTTTYTGQNGATKTLQTSASALAPTASTPLALVLSNLVVPSDANGSSVLSVQLTDPNGALVQSWANVTTNQTLSCTAANGSAGTTTGTYTWSLTAVPTVNNSGSGSYTVTVTAQAQWDEVATGGTYTYATTSGTAQTFATNSALAPTSAATQLSLQFASTACASDSNGSSQFQVTLTDPTSVQVNTWTVSGNTTLTYSAAGAGAGVYTWTVTAVIATNAQSATATTNYTDTATLTLGWYASVSVTTTTYTSNNGSSATYTLPGSTLAPTTSATQLSLTISAITAGADSAGASAYAITLVKPDGTQAKQWTGITTTQTLTWSASGAPAGAYSWTVYAYCTNNGTATSSYADSLNATLGWYQNVSSQTTTYTNVPGAASTAMTDATTLAPTSAATQLSFTISSLVAASDSNGASSWTITLTDPNANVVKTWSAITSTQTLSWFGAHAVAGAYTWTLQAVCTNTSTSAATYNDTIAGTLQWYESVTNTTTAFNVNAGTPQSIQTPTTTLAPTSLATQLTLNLSSVTTPSDANGTCSYSVTLQNPSNTVVGSWNSITAATLLTYSNGAAVAGQYTWTLNATVAQSASPAAETYTCSASGTLGWYISQTQSVTVYHNNASTSITSVSTDATTIAPTSTSTKLTFTPSSVSLPSDANGSTSYTVTLKNPSGQIVQSWTVTDTTQLTYYNAAAAAGSWTWQIQSACTNTGSGTSAYATTLAGTIGWYANQTQTIITATNHDGIAARYSTPGNTVPPTTAGTQLQLQLSSVITPSDSKGSSSIAVVLYDPNNQVVAAATQNNITAPTTISYYNASAISGTYTWVIYGQCANNDTAASSYAVSWSGTHSWYQPGPSSTQVYVLAADGFTQRLACADTNVDFQLITPGQVQFQITNSASVPLTFSLGVISAGF